MGRLLGAPPGVRALPGPGPGPPPSSDEPDSRAGESLPTLPRLFSLSNLCCRPLMRKFYSDFNTVFLLCLSCCLLLV